MKHLLHKLSSLRLLMLLAVLLGMGSSAAWADEVTIWSEDFTGLSSLPSSGTNATYAYNTTGASFYATEKTAGGTAPEIMIKKGGGSFSATITDLMGCTDFTLTYYTNQNGNLGVTVNNGASVTASSGSSNPYSKTISLGTANSLTITFTATSSSKNVRLDNIVLTGTKPASTASLSSIALSGTYPITFYQGDAFSHEGMTVTATYEDESTKDVTASAEFTGYDMSTTGNQTVTVSYTENEVTKTADYNITVNAPVSHNVTWSVNGVTNVESYKEGATITFPENPADISGKTFVGWVAEAIDGTTNEPPTFVTSATMGTSDVTYYAVFAYASGGGSSEVVDVLNYEWAGVTGTNYSSWSGKTATSSAVYAGNTAGGNDAIQLRSNNNNSGIVTTTSGGKATKLTVKWNGNTSAGRTLNVYGKNSAYSTASDLYNSSNQGTLLGTIVYDTSTELTIDDDYEYIGVRSASGALYLDKVEITWSTGGGVSYSDYCTTVVAATVAKPVITVASSFTFSTSVEMSCETDGATIYYTLDGTAPTSSSTEYDGAFSINATTTIKAIAIKGSDESEMTTVAATKNLAVPTVAIDATGITNTNVFDGIEAGSLAATVTYNEAAVEGAEVTWSGDNDEVATIDASTGAVTLVAAGTVTFTATYAGNSDYSEKAETYVMTVTNTDPNAPGTENNPYSVADAIAATPASGTSDYVYIRGVVSQFYSTSIMGDGSNYRYYISDDGGTDNQLLVYKGKGLNNVAFSSADDLQLGDVVTIYGGLTTYSNAPEVAANNYIVSLERTAKCATPTFNPAAGEYTSAQNVEISCATEGVTIYYTTDGTDPFSDPTAEPSVYTVPIAVDASMTIKAVAVKDGYENSDIAEAVYTIITTPVINADDIQLAYDATSGEINYTIDNELPGNVLDATTTADWISNIEISVGTVPGAGIVSFTTTTNDNLTARTATVTLTYGDISKDVTVEQAGFVVDYAELPFAFNDGKAAIEETTGLTQNGLGSDYASAPKLKFDTTGDNLVLKINERPGTLTFDIKGNSFSGGTFKVQTSEDGTVYSDLETYTDLGDKQEESFDNLGENVRYIKWIYTSKNNGNVALGNIALAEYVEPVLTPTVTVSETAINATAEETDGTITVTYENITEVYADIFFCDANGNSATYDWFEAEINDENNVAYTIGANTGDARTGYLKVYALDDNTNEVYSELITITQAGYVAPAAGEKYNLFTGELVEGDYIIYYNGKAMNTTVESDRLQYEEVTPENDVITTNNAAIVWHIAKSGDYWTIYNAEADAYAASTGAKNKAQMLADGTSYNAMWTISGSDTFEFVNRGNEASSVNSYLRNNGTYGFACYSEGIGGDLSLYKKAGVKLNAFGYATFSSTKAVDFTHSETSGYSAWAVTAINGSEITFTQIQTAVAAGTGVLLKGTASTEIDPVYVEEGEAVEGNKLVGITEATEVTEGEYYGLKGNNFVHVNAGVVPANKALLPANLIDSSVEVKGFTFVFEDMATGIRTIEKVTPAEAAEIFNLGGQRMNKVQRGINIVNGRKVLVK